MWAPEPVFWRLFFLKMPLKTRNRSYLLSYNILSFTNATYFVSLLRQFLCHLYAHIPRERIDPSCYSYIDREGSQCKVWKINAWSFWCKYFNCTLYAGRYQKSLARYCFLGQRNRTARLSSNVFFIWKDKVCGHCF